MPWSSTCTLSDPHRLRLCSAFLQLVLGPRTSRCQRGTFDGDHEFLLPSIKRVSPRFSLGNCKRIGDGFSGLRKRRRMRLV